MEKSKATADVKEKQPVVRVSSRRSSSADSKSSGSSDGSSSSSKSSVDDVKMDIDSAPKLSSQDLRRVQLSRLHLADHSSSELFKDLIENSIIRFSTSNGKYILGIVLDSTECSKPYQVAY